MIKKLRKKVDYHMAEVAKAKHSSHSIAFGFSLGSFISILPTPGFNIWIGMILTFIYKDLNKYSLFGAMALWNPFSLIPIYLTSKKIGNFIFGSIAVKSYELEMFSQVFDFTRRFLVGNLILATTISISSYFIVKTIVEKHREKHEKPLVLEKDY